MEPVSDAFTDSHPQRGRRKRLAVITGSFQIFPDRRWASLRLGTNARLPPKWHVCLSVCSLRCARRLPRATSTKVVLSILPCLSFVQRRSAGFQFGKRVG